MTRHGSVKSTHQRVPDEATSWQELKATPAKTKSKAANNSFRNPKFNNKKPMRKRVEEEVSANFVKLGERPSAAGSKMKVPKLVRIFGRFEAPHAEAERLSQLSKDLRSKGFSRKEVLTALQLERRRAERAEKRGRDKTCFKCRGFGHLLSECTAAGSSTGAGGSICFKCGSTEHTSRNCKNKSDTFAHATCFICKESGHISRQCPKNTRGIYPGGGACKLCDSTEHLAKDCPKLNPVSESSTTNNNEGVLPKLLNPYENPESEGSVPRSKNEGKKKKAKKLIKF